MATAVGGSVIWNLDVEPSKFESGLRKAKGEAKDFGKDLEAVGKESGSNFGASLGNSFSTIATGLGSLLKSIAVFSVGSSIGFGAAATAAFSQVKQVQDATFALKAYETNADKVNQVLSQLVQYARSDLGVLFQRQDLFDAASTLKIYGVETEKLVGFTKVLSKGVAIGKTTFQELSEVLGRVVTEGKLTSESFDLLARRGIKLPDTMRNAAVSADLLFAALDKSLPDTILEGRANTISGSMIRLQSAFRDVGSAILGVDKETSAFIKGGLGDTLVKSFDTLRLSLKDPAFIASLQNIGKSLAQFAKEAIPSLIAGFKFLVNNMGTLVAGLGALVVAFVAAKIAAIGFSIALSANPAGLIAAAVVTLIGVLTFLQLKFDIFGKAAKFLEPVLNILKSVFSDLWTSVKNLATVFGKELAPVFEFVNKHAEVFKKIGLTLLATVFTPLIATVGLFIVAIKILSGVINFLADNFQGIKKIVEIILTAAFAPLVLAIKGIQKVMEILGISWNDIWSSIGNTVNAAKQNIVNAIDRVKEIFKGLDDSISNIKNNFNEFKNDIVKTGKTIINTFSTTIDTITNKFNSFKSTAKSFKEVLTNAFDGGDGTKRAVTNIDTLNDKMAGMINGIFKTWGDDFSKAKESAANLFRGMSESVTTFVSSLPEKLSGIGSSIKLAWDNAYTSVTTFFTNTGNSITNFIINLPASLSGIWTSITMAWNNAYQATVTFFNELAGKLKPAVDRAGIDTANNVTDSLKNTMTTFESIRKIGDAILTMLSLAIILVIVYILDLGYRIGKSIIGGLIDGIRSLSNAVWEGIKFVSDKIGSFFVGAASWLYDTGKAIVQGMINGIRDMIRAVGDAAGEIGGAVKDKVKNILGIRSPSKVFYSFGQNITQGLIDGIDSGMAKVNMAAQDLSAGIIAPDIITRNASGNSSQTGTTINQTNNIYNETDMSLANKELGWKLANA